MSCEKREGLIPIRLHPQGRPIALLDNRRRLLAIPVHWHPHYFYECGSWTFDLRTWRHYRPSFDLVHVHLVVNDVSIIYRITALTFEQAGHSSYQCGDRGQKNSEKIHCPEPNFMFDRDLREHMPPPPYAEQARMPI